jgi:hypothetical protein
LRNGRRFDAALARSLAEPDGCGGLPFVYPGLTRRLRDGGATAELTVADFTCGAGADQGSVPWWVRVALICEETCYMSISALASIKATHAIGVGI